MWNKAYVIAHYPTAKLRRLPNHRYSVEWPRSMTPFHRSATKAWQEAAEIIQSAKRKANARNR